MGIISKVLNSFIRDSVLSALIEIYKGDNANVRIFNPPGIDSRPIDGDYGFAIESGSTEGGKDLVGFLDSNNIPISDKGEVRIYSRDSGGNIVALIHVKKDGIIEINGNADFAVRFSELETAFNQLKSDHDTHQHSGVDTGSGTSGPPVSGSTADISGAKVEEVKLP